MNYCSIHNSLFIIVESDKMDLQYKIFHHKIGKFDYFFVWKNFNTQFCNNSTYIELKKGRI